MKPQKNIRFCYGCHRNKMFFETKSKADNFIKFNKDEILKEKGYAPVRSYYCEFCCGFHVTSNSSIEVGERLDEKEHEIMTQFSQTKLDGLYFNEFYVGMIKEIDLAKKMLYECDFQKIEQLREKLQNLRTQHKVLQNLPPLKMEKFLLLSEKVENLYDLEIKIKKFIESDDDTLNKYLSSEHPSVEMSFIINGLLLKRQVLKEIEVIQIQLNEGNIAKALELKKELRHIVSTRENVQKKMKSECNKKISEIEHIIAQKKKEIQNKTLPVEEEPRVISPEEQISYRSTIIDAINILEEIKACFDNGDIDLCETKLETADFIVCELDVEDENTELVRSYIDMWKQKINETGK